MRKFLSVFVLTFFVKFGFAQVYQAMPQYGYGPVKRFDVDSTLTIPTVCGVPTLKSNLLRKSAIAFDTCNNRFYFYNSKRLIWDTIKGGSGGGGSTDTTSLSNRINLKLNIADSGSMLSPYLRKIDTTSLSNRINLKLNIADSGTMLSPYLRKIDTASLSNRINLKLNIADSTSMLSPYLRKIDTTNKWVNSVTKLNDSTIRVIKGATTTDITLTPSSTVTSATRLITQVYNKSGATITKGSVIYINDAHSSLLPTIALAKANAESTSAYTYGLVIDDISNNSEGTVIQNGTITNLNLPTNTYTDGQTLYLSPTVAGGYTTTKPLAPNHYVAIGTITRAHPNQGTIQVAIRNGFQLDEMSDVSIPLVPADSVLLQFSRVDSLWHDVSPITAIGTRYIKPSDTVSLSNRINTKLNATDTVSLSNRINTKLGASDTVSLSNRINTKLNTSDSSIYFSKYRSDTMRTNIYSAINGKQASGIYITASDTSVFQRKNIAAYSFMANKTNAAANVTANTFKDTSGTYSGSIAWTGTTAPSGSQNFSYQWTQVGKQVNLVVTLLYATVGSASTQVTASLPSDCPTPALPSGFSGASAILYVCNGMAFTSSIITMPTVTARCALRINSSNNGYELIGAIGSSNVRGFQFIVQYFAQ